MVCFNLMPCERFGLFNKPFILLKWYDRLVQWFSKTALWTASKSAGELGVVFLFLFYFCRRIYIT